MSTDQSPAVAQNVSDGIKNPVRRSVGRIQGCDPPNADGRSIAFGGIRPWFRPTDLARRIRLLRVTAYSPDHNGQTLVEQFYCLVYRLYKVQHQRELLHPLPHHLRLLQETLTHLQ